MPITVAVTVKSASLGVHTENGIYSVGHRCQLYGGSAHVAPCPDVPPPTPSPCTRTSSQLLIMVGRASSLETNTEVFDLSSVRNS